MAVQQKPCGYYYCYYIKYKQQVSNLVSITFELMQILSRLELLLSFPTLLQCFVTPRSQLLATGINSNTSHYRLIIAMLSMQELRKPSQISCNECSTVLPK